MARSRPWPFDDEDRPSGSVRPLSHADLQAILAHLGDDPDQLLAGTDADQPVVAIRARASVGRPGGSAQATWRRLRAAEWAVWTRALPWRVAVIVGIGAGGGLLGSQLAPRLGLLVAALAAAAAGWGLRFRPSPDAVAWRRGAAGERHTARLLDPLERHGWAVLHDLGIPGSRANLDHLVIGPGGVFVIDSKQYRGRLVVDPSGRLWHGRFPLAPTVRAVSFEADQAAQVLTDPDVVVVPVMAIHGAQVPWGKVVMEGVPVVAARHLPGHAAPAPGGGGARTGRRPGRPGPGPLPRRRVIPGAWRAGSPPWVPLARHGIRGLRHASLVCSWSGGYLRLDTQFRDGVGMVDEPNRVTRARERAADAKLRELAAHRRAEERHEEAAKMQERTGHRDRAQAARGRAQHARELYLEALREQAKAIAQAPRKDAR